MTRFAAALAASVALAGCGSAASSTTTQSAMPVDPPAGPAGPTRYVKPAAAPPPSGNCRIFRSGADVSVEVGGPGAVDLCDRWMRSWSVNGAFWTQTDQTEVAGDGGRHYGLVVCSMTSGYGVVARVDDSAGAYFGRGICGDLVRDGWAEVMERDVGKEDIR